MNVLTSSNNLWLITIWHTNWYQKESTPVIIPRKQSKPAKITSYWSWHQLTRNFHCHNGENLLNNLTLTWNSSTHTDSILNFQPMLKYLALSIIKKLHCRHLAWKYWPMSFPSTVTCLTHMQSRVSLYEFQWNITADFKYLSLQLAGSVFLTLLYGSPMVSSS